jgi:hypothetical protein
MADILIIRNNCDPATFGTYHIGEGLLVFFQGKGHTVTELADAQATPANVQFWLNTPPIRTAKLVVALDHGSNTAFFGELNNKAEPVITTANVQNLTKGLHVYTFACSTNANNGLGQTAINKGTYSWLGYTEPVYVFTDPNTALFKKLKEVIWSYLAKLADGFTLETAEKALRDAYAACKNDAPLFSYNLQRLLLRKQAAGMTIHSHNRLGGKSLIGTWGGMVDWAPFDTYVSAGNWTFKNDGTWSYASGGGRWIQVEDTAIWTFNNAPGLVYTCTVTANGLKGVMGYTTQSPSGKGRFMAARAASLDEAATDILLGPAREVSVDGPHPAAGEPLPAEVISVPVLAPV